jgi:LAO/AO transport system kinase
MKDEGIVELVDAIQRHRAYLAESGTLTTRAQRQVRSEVQSLILQAAVNALKAQVPEAEWQKLVADITTRQCDPYSVANDLERRIGLNAE